MIRNEHYHGAKRRVYWGYDSLNDCFAATIWRVELILNCFQVYAQWWKLKTLSEHNGMTFNEYYGVEGALFMVFFSLSLTSRMQTDEVKS